VCNTRALLITHSSFCADRDTEVRNLGSAGRTDDVGINFFVRHEYDERSEARIALHKVMLKPYRGTIRASDLRFGGRSLYVGNCSARHIVVRSAQYRNSELWSFKSVVRASRK
jgi:hypothetical protein